MKPLYLNGITNSKLIDSFLVMTLEDMIGVRGEYTVVPFSYPGWPTADYISKMSGRISDAMYEAGLKMAKERFKNFNPEKTKITKEMLEEIWMEATKAITKEIYAGFEEGQENRIPGLGESIENGAIIPRDRDEVTEEGILAAREMIKAKAEKNDYRDELLRKFRERYFSYMQENYGKR